MSRKPLPVLQEMPFHIKQRIAGNLKRYTDKIALRSFSAEFRQIIGNPRAHLEHLLFSCQKEKILLRVIENGCCLDMSYRPTDQGCLISKDWTPQGPGHLVKDQDHVLVALRDFQALTGNPNLTVDHFDLGVLTPKVVGFIPKLITGKLRVRILRLIYSGQQKEVVPVLTHLDLDFLNYLTLGVSDKVIKTVEYDELVKLDHWKNVQRLQLCKHLSRVIPMEHWWETYKLAVELDSRLEMLRVLVHHFSETPTFQYCVVTTALDAEEIKNTIGKNFPWKLEDDGVHSLRYIGLENQILIIKVESGKRIQIFGRN